MSIVQVTNDQMAEIKGIEAVGGFNDTHALKSNVRLANARGVNRAAQYHKYMDSVDWMLKSNDPRVVAQVKQINAGLAGLMHKDIATATVHQNATLSNLSVQYANEMYIGEMLMPILQVAKETDTYYSYGQSDRMQYPDDELGSRGQANEIQENRATTSYTCNPYGYSNFVSQRTLNNQDAPLDEMVDLVEAINEGLAFRRELRIATVLTTGANFGANTAAIAAGVRWDTALGGDPISDIKTAQAALWQGTGPGSFIGYCSLDVWNVLCRHPAILDLFKYGGSSPGLATPDMFAGFFGLDGLLIGKARQDSTNEATAATYSRVWGDVFGIVRVATRASIRNAVFGYTFRHLSPETNVVFDPLKGHGGGFTAQVSVSETHDVVASPTGYLITTPIG